MRIAVLGTGGVGRSIASRLGELGHEVTMGSARPTARRSRNGSPRPARERKGAPSPKLRLPAELRLQLHRRDRFAGGAGGGGAENLAGKTLIDVAVPSTSPAGCRRELAICNDDSLGERIQAAFPDTRVVKALNTVNRRRDGEPARVRGEHAIFVCGDDDAAKAQVSALLEAFGWPAEAIVDLGGIEAAPAPRCTCALAA